MKIRYVLFGVNIAIILLFAIGYRKIEGYDFRTEDMVELNETYCFVKEELGAGADIDEVEKKYDCELIFIENEGYTAKLYKAMSRQDVIFDYVKDGTLEGKIMFARNTERFSKLKSRILQMVCLLLGSALIIMDAFSFFLYIRLIRPFQKLKQFAGNIALGDLDAPLERNRNNYFGEFTESFDIMREELKAAREGEYQANLSKRELVASLSHDIKTPVSTIKALCEILQIKLKSDENAGKIDVIAKKADVIDQLISNMFHATLEELEVLKVSPIEEPSSIILKMLQDMNHFGSIEIENDIPSCLIWCDKLRLNQVIDNIVSNSYKYANTKIQVRFAEALGYITVEIRDFGHSAKDVDLFLVCEKFYRGENAAGKNGSGLGLYLANTFMEAMEGQLVCEQDNGFVVTIQIKKAGNELRNG